MLKLLNKLAFKTNIIDKERGIKGREREIESSDIYYNGKAISSTWLC